MGTIAHGTVSGMLAVAEGNFFDFLNQYFLRNKR